MLPTRRRNIGHNVDTSPLKTCHCPIPGRQNNIFPWHICKLFSGGRGSFVALPAARQTGGPPAHYIARLGAGRAPWRVLWASKAARAGLLHKGLRSTPPSRAGPRNPQTSVYFLSVVAEPRRALNISILCGSHGATETAIQAFPFVTVANEASACVCVCVIS